MDWLLLIAGTLMLFAFPPLGLALLALSYAAHMAGRQPVEDDSEGAADGR